MARHATGAAQRVAVATETLRDEKFNARRVELAEAALETSGFEKLEEKLREYVVCALFRCI